MSHTAVPASNGVSNPKRPRRAQQTGGPGLGQDTSRDARRVAAAVLEVLAGARTPTEAAQALAVTVPRYYQVESQALKGLVAACAPKPKGRVKSPDKELTMLRRDNQRLQREVSRQQALVRLAQRTIGLAAPVSPPAGKSAKKTRKRRVARALSVAARLQQQNAEAAAPAEAADSP
jgi:hypothetical protein